MVIFSRFDLMKLLKLLKLQTNGSATSVREPQYWSHLSDDIFVWTRFRILIGFFTKPILDSLLNFRIINSAGKSDKPFEVLDQLAGG